MKGAFSRSAITNAVMAVIQSLRASDAAYVYEVPAFQLTVADPSWLEPGHTPNLGAAGQFDTLRLRDPNLTACAQPGTVEVLGPVCDVFYRCDGGVNVWHGLSILLSDDAVNWFTAGGLYSHDHIDPGGAVLRTNDFVRQRIWIPARYCRFNWRRPTAASLAADPDVFGGTLTWSSATGD